MFPSEAYKQMSYAHKEKESFCNDNFCVNQTSSSMQMVRPSPCMPTTHHHHVAGIHHDGHHLIPGKPHESHHSHGHKDHQYCIKENCCDEKRHHEGSHHGKEKFHTNARVSEFVKEEAIKICSDKPQRSGGYGGGETHHHHAPPPVVAEPYYYKQETTKYSGGPNGRVHYVEYKGLED